MSITSLLKISGVLSNNAPTAESRYAPTAESRYFTPLITPCTLLNLFYNVFIEEFRGTACAMYVMQKKALKEKTSIIN